MIKVTDMITTWKKKQLKFLKIENNLKTTLISIDNLKEKRRERRKLTLSI